MSEITTAVEHAFLKRDYLGAVCACVIFGVALVAEAKAHRIDKDALDDVLKANKRLAKAFEDEKEKAKSLDKAVMELRRELYNAQNQNKKD